MTGVAIPFSDASTFYSDIKRLPELVGGEHYCVELQQDVQPYRIRNLPNPKNWANMNLLGKEFPAAASAFELCRQKGFIILHCPIGKISFNGMMCNRDISNPNTDIREMSIIENQAALSFADYLGAAGYVLHVTNCQKDSLSERKKMMDISLLSLEQLFEFYLKNVKTKTRILIENLEFPKFPARSDEFEWYFKEACRRFRQVESRLGPDYKRDFHVLGMLLDVPHFTFNEMLRCGFNIDTLQKIPQWVEGFVNHNANLIRYYHLAGCKIHNDKGLWLSTHDYVDEIEREYSLNELNMEKILTIPQIKRNDMLLEVANVPYYYLANTRANVLNFLQRPCAPSAISMMKYPCRPPRELGIGDYDLQLFASDSSTDFAEGVTAWMKTRLGTISLPVWRDRVSRAYIINTQFAMERLETMMGKLEYDSELEKIILKINIRT